jgi:dynein heavy chain
MALDKIAPCLNDAINSMQQLSKYQLAEVRSLTHPPKMVKTVLKAVCVLLDVEPQMKRKANGENKMSYWRAAISSLVLADPNLPQRLEQFDRNKLSEEKMGRVEEIISGSDYTFENVKKSCFAVEGLFLWVKAIRDYFYIFRELEPRRDALILAEKQYQDKLQ